MRIRTRSASAVAILVAVLAVALPRVAAHNAYDNLMPIAGASGCSFLGNCLADNSSQTWHIQDGFWGGTEGAIRDRMAYLDTKFDLAFIEENPPSMSGGSETDIIWIHVWDNGSDLPGWTRCDDVNGSTCDQFYVTVNQRRLSEVGYQFWHKKWLMCHEGGHTVGLQHGVEADPEQPNDSDDLACLMTLIPLSEMVGWIGSHNIHQVNGHY